MKIFQQTIALLRQTPLDLICENGHTQLLKYMLPLLEKEMPEDPETLIRRFSQDLTLMVPSTYTAVQKAAEKGHTEVVMFMEEYFRGRKPRVDCDIHYVDDASGENCALLACKSGKKDLIRFLHEQCKADFSLVNRRRESSLQLTAVGSRKSCKGSDFQACFKYLCEVVKVDISHEPEEILLLLEDRKLIDYVETRLKLNGLNATKALIEQKNTPYQRPPVVSSQAQFRDSDLSSIIHVPLSDEDMSAFGF